MTSEGKKKDKSTLGLKVISVVLAVLLWFYIGNQGQSNARQDTVPAKIHYINLAEGLSLSGPSQVSVKLWGTVSQTGEVVAVADLKGLGPGSHRVPVKVQPVKGAMLTTVVPDQVEVKLSPTAEKRLPTSYEIIRNPAPGFEVMDVVIQPDNCLVSGDPGQLSRVARVVAQVDLASARNVINLEVSLQARDAANRDISATVEMVPRTVNVYAVVVPVTDNKTVEVKALTGGSPAEGYRVSEVRLEPSTVTLLGGKAQIEGIDQVSTKALDVTGQSQSFSQEIDIQDLSGVKVYPSRVLATVIIEKTVAEGTQ